MSVTTRAGAEPAEPRRPAGGGESAGAPPADVRRLRRGAFRLAAALVVVGLIVVFAPGLGAVRHRFSGLSTTWLLLAVGLELLSCVSYLVVFRAVFAPGFPWRRTLRLGLSEIAVTALLPVGGAGGLALGAWVLRRRGVPGDIVARRSVAFFVLTSAVNFGAVVVVGLAMGVGLLPSHGGRGLSLAAAVGALVIGALFVTLGRHVRHLSLPRPAARAAEAVAAALDDVPGLLRGSGPAPLAGAIGYWLFDVAALWAVLQAVGAHTPSGAVAMAHLLGMLGGLLPVPGGLGGVDAGLAGVLVAYGAAASAAVAAVLAFRVIVLAVALAVGLPAGIALLRAETAPGGVPEVEAARIRAAIGESSSLRSRQVC